MQRRSFLGTPLAALQGAEAPHVYANTDRIPLTSAEYARLIEKSSESAVEALEKTVASLLGKEGALWMPTRTLASHIALHVLAGAKRRVIVQAESQLHGLDLVPLAAGKATFTLAEAEAQNDIGAIHIESPVRRCLGERFDFGQMQAISAYARRRGIGLHMDGAGLFIESAYTRRPVRDYAALFDTLYVSAVLAGPKSIVEEARRLFGGDLDNAWTLAAVALHFIEGFEQRFRSAIETSELVIAALSTDSNFEIQRVPNGTNIFRLRATSVNAPVYKERLELAGITASLPESEWFTIRVNETWRRVPAEEIVARFRKALG